MEAEQPASLSFAPEQLLGEVLELGEEFLSAALLGLLDPPELPPPELLDPPPELPPELPDAACATLNVVSAGAA